MRLSVGVAEADVTRRATGFGMIDGGCARRHALLCALASLLLLGVAVLGFQAGVSLTGLLVAFVR